MTWTREPPRSTVRTMAVFSKEWEAAETNEHEREAKARAGKRSQPRMMKVKDSCKRRSDVCLSVYIR